MITKCMSDAEYDLRESLGNLIEGHIGSCNDLCNLTTGTLDRLAEGLQYDDFLFGSPIDRIHHASSYYEDMPKGD